MRTASTLAVLIASTAAFGQTVGDVVSRVSQSSYRDFLDNRLYTHYGQSRGYGGEHDLARGEIQNAFSAAGLTTNLHGFNYNSNTYYNVVGFKQGTRRPNDVYVLGAHYDSVGNPGADDNGSGTAGLMEAARVLSQFSFEASIYLVAFDREEQGLVGSWHWVNDNMTLNILGAVSMDMIAYNPAGANQNKAFVYGRTSSNPLKTALAAAVSAYGNGITPTVGGDMPYSDHASFEQRGFQAACLIEHEVWSNPYYHSPLDSVDTPGYIDYAYATGMTRAGIGFMATQAVLTPEPSSLVIGAWLLLAARRRRTPAK